MSYAIVELDARVVHRRATVRRLLNRCRVADRRPPLGDHALGALVNGDPNTYALGVLDPSSRLVGYAQATPTSEVPPTWTIDIAIDPSHRHDHATILDSTFGAVLDKVHARGGRAVQWWCHELIGADRAIAERHGLFPTRELLEMHVHLGPLRAPPRLDTHSFVTGTDEPALLEVNNLAFAHHPDQGNWTLDSLAGRLNSEWFDPAGLLVHRDADGTMLGFCWTKIHRSPTGSMGEIYVVAVRPSFHGSGLGGALTHDGLVSLHERGIDYVMLFVDSSNAPALSVYRRLGFAVTSSRTALQQTMTPITPTTTEPGRHPSVRTQRLGALEPEHRRGHGSSTSSGP